MKFSVARVLFLCLLAPALFTGCASVAPRHIAVSSRNVETVRYKNGIAIISSSKINSVEFWLIQSEVDPRGILLPAVAVSITNRSNEAFEISAENVDAFASGIRQNILTEKDITSRVPMVPLDTYPARVRLASEQAGMMLKRNTVDVDKKVGGYIFFDPRSLPARGPDRPQVFEPPEGLVWALVMS